MNEADRVQKVITELKDLGYYSFQINEIIRENIGTEQLSNLSPERMNELIEQLETHLFFARKCKTIK